MDHSPAYPSRSAHTAVVNLTRASDRHVRMEAEFASVGIERTVARRDTASHLSPRENTVDEHPSGLCRQGDDRRQRFVKSGAVLLVGAACILSGCDPQYDAREAELRNFKPTHLVPKSSPAALVKAFDTYCIEGPKSPSELRKKLESAGYVAYTAQPRDGVHSFVVDNKRPAVLITSDGCAVAAASRSGHTERLRSYVASTFPNAKTIDPAPLGDQIEDAWVVPTEPKRVVATQRSLDPMTYLSRYMIMSLPVQ